MNDLQKTNRQITNEKNKYLTIFSSLPTPIIVFNPELEIQDMNFAFEKTFFLGDVPGEYYYAKSQNLDKIDWIVKIVNKFLESPDKMKETEHQIQIGKKFHTFSLFLNKMLDVSKKFEGIIVFIYDITHRKKIEEENRLFEQNMNESQKLESLGILSGGIAHDFNNLLTAIIGNAELAEMTTNDFSVKEYIDNIIQASNDAKELTNQLLSYSGRKHAKKRVVDINKLITTIKVLLKHSISKKANLILDLQDHLPPILADESQIQQIIMNLVLNASEALNNQKGKIEIKTYIKRKYSPEKVTLNFSKPIQKDFLALEINDTGMGIPKTLQKKIFDPFFTTKFQGRGLGLAVVVGNLKAHEAILNLESQINTGTHFQILFPIQKSLRNSISVNSVNIDFQKITTYIKNKTIVIVDDEVQVRDTLYNYLKKYDAKVFKFQKGTDALQEKDLIKMYAEGIFLDLTMPDMNGHEVYQLIRQENQSVPIFFMSGYTKKSIESIQERDKHVFFIQKPFSITDIMMSFQEWLGIKAHS